MSKAIWGLEKFELFKGLNAMELKELQTIISKVVYNKGDIIIDINNKSRDVFVLMEGRVDIVSLSGVPLYRVTAGETFGEMALVPSIKRTAVAVAREESWVLVLNIGHLESLGEQSPSIYRQVHQNIVFTLGVKLARANKLIELLKAELAKSLKK